ncbi:MAG TPA: hypothetical protein DCL21_04735 [Alphaproteobacteria bacterium]|nr:hypothetical protein [Alphaproteobacteria bacterium]
MFTEKMKDAKSVYSLLKKGKKAWCIGRLVSCGEHDCDLDLLNRVINENDDSPSGLISNENNKIGSYNIKFD